MQRFEIAGHVAGPGDRIQFDLPAAQLYTHTPLDMTVEVIRGAKPGPVLLVCAAIHGNEINGVEIIRRLRSERALKRLRGTLVLVPVVNLHGFIHQSRYLPDRRDMNRCFPGSEHGSLGSRVAYRFFSEVVRKCTHIIDLHTAAINRDNLPQIRAALDDPVVKEMALGFSIPVIINAGLIENTLRAEAGRIGIPVITYEAGEALRLSEKDIVTGVRGVLNTMRTLNMLPKRKSSTRVMELNIASSTHWVRASGDGLFRPLAQLGSKVKQGETLGVVTSPFSAQEQPVASTLSGIVIGMNRHPLVNEGEALFHVGEFARVGEVEAQISNHVELIEADPLFEIEQVEDVDLG